MKMKLVTAALLAGVLSVSARTWTSADGSKALEGELKSFDAESGKVLLDVAGAEVEFTLDKLSKSDQDFLKKQGGATADLDVASILAEAKMHRLVDGKYQDATLEGKPDYYLVYFSASW